MDGYDVDDFARENRWRKCRQYLVTVADKMKERKISRAEIARQLDKSASHIGNVLRGEYPYRDAWGWPQYFGRWVEDHLGITEP